DHLLREDLARRRLQAGLALPLHEKAPLAVHRPCARRGLGEQGTVRRGCHGRLRGEVVHRGVRGENVALVRVEVGIAPVHARRGCGAEADDLPGPDELGRRARAEHVLLLLRDGGPGGEGREDDEGPKEAARARAGHFPRLARYSGPTSTSRGLAPSPGPPVRSIRSCSIMPLRRLEPVDCESWMALSRLSYCPRLARYSGQTRPSRGVAPAPGPAPPTC